MTIRSVSVRPGSRPVGEGPKPQCQHARPGGVGLRRSTDIRRFPATVLVMLVTLAIGGTIGYVIFNQLVEIISDLPSYRENIDKKVQSLRASGKGAIGRAAQSVNDLGKQLATPAPEVIAPPLGKTRAARAAAPAGPLPVQVVEQQPNELQYIREVSKSFLAPLADLGIVLVFTLFLLVEEADLRNRIFRLAGLHRLNLMTQAVQDGTRRVSRYLMLQFLVNAGFGLLCAIGLYFIGVPYAALWGTLAAMLRIVPYVGSISAGLLPLLLSLAIFEGWRHSVLVLLLFTALELITGNVLEPMLYGAHTGISSLALLLTTVFWAGLWGGRPDSRDTAYGLHRGAGKICSALIFSAHPTGGPAGNGTGPTTLPAPAGHGRA